MRMLDYVRLSNTRLTENLLKARELVTPLVGEYLSAKANLLSNVAPETSSSGLPEATPAIRALRPLRLVASGSSKNACDCARLLMERELGVQVTVVTPEAFVSHAHMHPADALTIAISQSGFSTNTIAALDFLRARGERAILLTGNTGAPASFHADATIDYGVGVESVDFVTMGVQALIEFLMLFALHAAHSCNRLDETGLSRGCEALDAAIAAHAVALDRSEAFVTRNRLALARRSSVILVGNGPNVGVLEEAALKLMETLKRPAMTFECEEFVHGPEMQVDPSYTLFFVDDPEGSERMAKLAEAFAKVAPDTHLVTSCPAGKPWEIPLPTLPDPLMCAIPNLVPFQHIAAAMAEELGCWDVHPFLKAEVERLGAKEEGYEDAVRELERQAALSYKEQS